ncbi:transposase [Alloalcanivorax xenomutans]|uniref:transposase n=1 Tax=Alloalcanivorax xenomutans TaxID=1094342 RepID=UPI0009B6B5C3
MDPLSVSQPQPQPRRRRHFSREFKAHIVAACQEPSVSVSRIALDNQLNANLVRRWIREAEQAGQTITSPAFMPLAVPVASCPVLRDHEAIHGHYASNILSYRSLRLFYPCPAPRHW